MDFELTGLYMKNALTGTLVAYLYVLADPERGSPSMIRKTSDVETQIYREKEMKKESKLNTKELSIKNKTKQTAK